MSPKGLLSIILKCSSDPIHEAARLGRVDLLQLIFESWSLISKEVVGMLISIAFLFVNVLCGSLLMQKWDTYLKYIFKPNVPT